MSRRRWLAILALLVIGLAWSPLIRPTFQGGVVLLELYSPTLAAQPGAPSDRDLAALVTPEPRVTDTIERFAGVEMRVTWSRPGWGDRHPGILVVNGATPAGNDDPVTRRFTAALARAGYLVMLPELPFLKIGRLEASATAQVDAAFEMLRALSEVERASAFGSSVGGGVLLAAAGRERALPAADALIVLGAYFDLDTYLASVATATQRRDGSLAPWEPSDEVRDRLPRAALDGMVGTDRDALANALAATGYDAVLARLASLPATARASIDALSPRAVWSGLGPPVFWLHDPNDRFEPLAEAEAAQRAPRAGSLTLAEPGVISHAAPVAGPLAELISLLGFATSAIRATD